MSDLFTKLGQERETWVLFKRGEVYQDRVLKERCRARGTERFQYRWPLSGEGKIAWWVVSVQWDTLEAFPKPPSWWRRLFQRKPRLPTARLLSKG